MFDESADHFQNKSLAYVSTSLVFTSSYVHACIVRSETSSTAPYVNVYGRPHGEEHFQAHDISLRLTERLSATCGRMRRCGAQWAVFVARSWVVSRTLTVAVFVRISSVCIRGIFFVRTNRIRLFDSTKYKKIKNIKIYSERFAGNFWWTLLFAVHIEQYRLKNVLQLHKPIHINSDWIGRTESNESTREKYTKIVNEF